MTPWCDRDGRARLWQVLRHPAARGAERVLVRQCGGRRGPARDDWGCSPRGRMGRLVRGNRRRLGSGLAFDNRSAGALATDSRPERRQPRSPWPSSGDAVMRRSSAIRRGGARTRGRAVTCWLMAMAGSGCGMFFGIRLREAQNRVVVGRCGGSLALARGDGCGSPRPGTGSLVARYRRRLCSGLCFELRSAGASAADARPERRQPRSRGPSSGAKVMRQISGCAAQRPWVGSRDDRLRDCCSRAGSAFLLRGLAARSAERAGGRPVRRNSGPVGLGRRDRRCSRQARGWWPGAGASPGAYSGLFFDLLSARAWRAKSRLEGGRPRAGHTFFDAVMRQRARAAPVADRRRVSA